MPEPSGRILLRLPPALHGELTRRAAEQGVSLNQLLVALLAGAVEFSLIVLSPPRPAANGRSRQR